MQLEMLTEAIDRLMDLDVSACADPETIETLERQLTRLDGFVTAAVGAFDASGAWASEGACTASSWLVTRCAMAKNAAKGQLRRGRLIREFAQVGRAWSAGDLAASHVDALGSVRRPATEEALQRDESLLVQHATTLSFEHFTRSLRYWEQFADPDGAEVEAERLRTRREVHLSSSFGGLWFGKMTLDPIAGAIVAEELSRLEQGCFEADWSQARDALGREPTMHDLARDPAQRRADALVEMATRSRTTPETGHRPSPLFSVLVGYETLHGRICQLAQGTVLTPGSLVRWLDEALIERAVFTPTGRVEVSATARLFTGATRRALELRDGQCTHPYCDRPAQRCQGDHITPFAEGGLTTQENGRLLCGFHNRLRNTRPEPDP
jgi:hypothetical protein